MAAHVDLIAGLSGLLPDQWNITRSRPGDSLLDGPSSLAHRSGCGRSDGRHDLDRVDSLPIRPRAAFEQASLGAEMAAARRR